MTSKEHPLSRRDFLKFSSLTAGALSLPKSLRSYSPEKDEVIPEWPTVNKNLLPENLRTTLDSIPEAILDSQGYLKVVDETQNQRRVVVEQTDFNKENSRSIDKLYTKYPWAIVLHWTGGKFNTVNDYVTRGFNAERQVQGGDRTKTSAHFLVGDKPVSSIDSTDKPLSIAQTQIPDKDGVPFRAAHLSPVDWNQYVANGRRWYPVNAMYEMQHKEFPKFHSVLQDIYDGTHISVDMRTVGIEIGGAFFDEDVPKAQTTENVIATVWALMKAYKVPAWSVLGHYEIQPGKSDPGREYLSTVRFLLGVKALVDNDTEMKELVFGDFIDESQNLKKAAQAYFDSVRDYLVLTSYPISVSSFEKKVNYWNFYSQVFGDKEEIPNISFLKSPIRGQDIATGSKFLEQRDDGGYHTGYDYNMENDKGKPVYLIGNAKCVYSGYLGEGFGNTAIFRLRTPLGQDFLVRYMHLEELPDISVDTIYNTGVMIGKIGKSGGQLSEHLHLDIAPLATYEVIGEKELKFNYWPKPTVSKERVASQFVDPHEFINAYNRYFYRLHFKE